MTFDFSKGFCLFKILKIKLTYPKNVKIRQCNDDLLMVIKEHHLSEQISTFVFSHYFYINVRNNHFIRLRCIPVLAVAKLTVANFYSTILEQHFYIKKKYGNNRPKHM